MDGIIKLRGLSNWAYVQCNIFPGQGDDSDKAFVFKMSEVGPGSGVHLIRLSDHLIASIPSLTL